MGKSRRSTFNLPPLRGLLAGFPQHSAGFLKNFGASIVLRALLAARVDKYVFFLLCARTGPVVKEPQRHSLLQCEISLEAFPLQL
jgi:hypothetical protein